MTDKLDLEELGTDWDAVAEGEVVPEGRYPARVDKITPETSEESGNAYWGVTFTITEGDQEGRKVWTPCMLQANSLWKLRQLADAAGVALAGRSDLDPEELVEQEVGIQITQRSYQGSIRANVKSFYKLGG